jgi:hypothetical protein
MHWENDGGTLGAAGSIIELMIADVRLLIEEMRLRRLGTQISFFWLDLVGFGWIWSDSVGLGWIRLDSGWIPVGFRLDSGWGGGILACTLPCFGRQ